MKINHYINYEGQTEAVFAFYASVFGGESRLMRFGQMSSDGVALSETDACFFSSTNGNGQSAKIA